MPPRGDRTPGSRLATSCPPLVDFAGARYVGSGVAVAPTEGPVLGTGTEVDVGEDALGDASVGDASCALVVRFRGAVYEGLSGEVSPGEGESLGPGVLPACGDGGGASADEEIELAEIEGVSPDIAVSWAGRSDTVFVRRGAEIPAEVEGLLRAPTCEPRDALIELSGSWLGILGADGNTELDLEPPYDLDLFVEETSEPQYERTYRVPPALGKPITRDDIKASLWEGGTIALRVRCSDDGGFVAEDVAVFPPS